MTEEAEAVPSTEAAVMMASPGAMAVTWPLASTVATVSSLLVQLTRLLEV